MRRILLFLFILFFTGEIYSRDYVNYNIKVLGAQMLLLKDDIDSALIIYKQAFELVDKPFPKDLLNAAFAAYYADSLYLMKHCITSAIEVGAYFKFVKKKFKNKYKNKDFCNLR